MTTPSSPAEWAKVARAKHSHFVQVFPTADPLELHRLERHLAALVPLLCDAIDELSEPSDGEHVHRYRILATRLIDGRNMVVAFERFLTAEPKYGFRCPCGDVQTLDLGTAAEHGWIEVLDLAGCTNTAKPPADTSWIKTEDR